MQNRALGSSLMHIPTFNCISRPDFRPDFMGQLLIRPACICGRAGHMNSPYTRHQSIRACSGPRPLTFLSHTFLLLEVLDFKLHTKSEKVQPYPPPKKSEKVWPYEPKKNNVQLTCDQLRTKSFPGSRFPSQSTQAGCISKSVHSAVHSGSLYSQSELTWKYNLPGCTDLENKLLEWTDYF